MDEFYQSLNIVQDDEAKVGFVGVIKNLDDFCYFCEVRLTNELFRGYHLNEQEI
jgi:hypothetical protein